MEWDPWKMAGLYGLLARLRLDADLGVEFLSGNAGDVFMAIETLAKAAPAAPAASVASSAPSALSARSVASGATERIPDEPRIEPRREFVAERVAVPTVFPVAPESVPVRPAGGRAGAPGLPAGHVSLVPFEPGPVNAEKEALLADLRKESETCTLCGLCERRNSVVWGEGSLDADVMFIGEGPGRDEDIEGRPFVGRSGRLLTDIIEKGIQRPRSSMYIANVVKCRPPGNRDPRPDEVAACSVYLNRQIAVIKPAVIVAVGMVAGRALLGLPPGTSGLRNQWRMHENIPMRVIYHPSYLLRQRQSERDRTEADKATWRDIQEVMKKAAEIRGRSGD